MCPVELAHLTVPPRALRQQRILALQRAHTVH